ncbi:MAG: YopX family protein [Lachnospiraceae bacterium]|nr:YopX family protein [Lachnospiraceae bacterium]
MGQYTGLDDKNGKEIYEGDVVYCQTKYGKAKAIIKFIDGKFAAYWNSALTHPENGHHIACYEINKRFEVIGNIYDNSELLGGE